ncbi:uncharacterized protein N7479_003358 [Penicillium vulpinum]|uniref:NACHT-NTPase and P-loop NTPases N-terminal domain-containing protein n=1 Tax=Penicillium vulpinum TaxID=29845 RepID=A0A1V6S358_9EURO|nr:uncharacterized protein N7479_003358 [Penicillium vulpinum]KAJ5963482.1 hypothetical protein N7479_003358 [Penicillium vulpinum]OQE08475.1 hypothetical protein PENVUL_c009G06002 [Penicillium vulpinum]
MAEVIGIVSGAITFATVIIQVEKSISELKDCWDQLQDAPEGLRKLIQQVELFGLILADIEEDLQQVSFSTALNVKKNAQQSLEFFKAASRDLEALCKDLNRDGPPSNRMHKSRKALRFVMSKGKIEKHTTHLENDVHLLALSQQC